MGPRRRIHAVVLGAGSASILAACTAIVGVEQFPSGGADATASDSAPDHPAESGTDVATEAAASDATSTDATSADTAATEAALADSSVADTAIQEVGPQDAPSDACTPTSCPSGKVCSAGACVAGCLIGGTFYAAGQPQSSSSCNVCQPGASTSAWSPLTCATSTCSGGACSGSTTTGASCQAGGNGLTNCGAASESCCTSIEVPGGTFSRTYDNADTGGPLIQSADGGPTLLSDPATVSGFRLDKYEVTVGRFRQFVSAWKGGWRPADGSGKHTHVNGGQGLVNSNAISGGPPGPMYEPGWDATDWSGTTFVDPSDTNLTMCSQNATDPYATWTSSTGTHEQLPMNCVTFYEAYAFCIWDGGFLASYAEWEYAAAGGARQLLYPWGLPASPGASTQYAVHGCYYPNPAAPDGGFRSGCTGAANIPPVGTAALGAGPWGHLDLAGSLWEPTLDEEGFLEPCVDCVLLAPATGDHTLHGGSFDEPDTNLWTPGENTINPAYRADTGGIRCARTP
jgi:formylglycine-generating enzyme required for sulfatase activity